MPDNHMCYEDSTNSGSCDMCGCITDISNFYRYEDMYVCSHCFEHVNANIKQLKRCESKHHLEVKK